MIFGGKKTERNKNRKRTRKRTRDNVIQSENDKNRRDLG